MKNLIIESSFTAHRSAIKNYGDWKRPDIQIQMLGVRGGYRMMATTAIRHSTARRLDFVQW
jgi:hypothetical protein